MTGPPTAIVPIGWDEAFAGSARRCAALPDPNMAEFYTSGRASNEAAFLFSCSRANTAPTISRLLEHVPRGDQRRAAACRSASARARCRWRISTMPTLIFSIGHNPGTNHPRMMTTLRDASRRGVPIIVFNPLKERALERFADPQDPIEMATTGLDPDRLAYYQVKVGGDVAVLKGIMKAVLARRRRSRAGGPGVLDRAFIAEHTNGFEALPPICATRDGRDRAPVWPDRARRWKRPAVYAPPTPPSCATAWASPSTATAPKTCSRSPICCCCAAISASRAPASARCAAIPTCRATARSASPKSPARAARRHRAGLRLPPPAAHGP
jgi:anaerobic selenocysteine-containing dehydrogenase